MQLPRGTFRSIRKGVSFNEFLAETVSSRFTGTCTISSAALNGTLVFRNGVCVLAKIQDQYGDRGWAEVSANSSLVVDLALSDFTTAQIQLALDFNRKALVTAPTAPVQQKTDHPAAPAARSISREPSRQAIHPRREERKREVQRPPSPASEAVPEKIPPAQSSPPPHNEPGTLAEPVGQIDSGREAIQENLPKKTEDVPGPREESDLDMFDSMDLDDVALKIRKDCKIILKQLQLDHLTEK